MGLNIGKIALMSGDGARARVRVVFFRSLKLISIHIALVQARRRRRRLFERVQNSRQRCNVR